MSSDVAISVRGLSKSYTIRHNQVRHTTLGEAFRHRVTHPLERPSRELFWALDDVSFDVQHGEVLGIIGRNGAGKSTLLKVLSRITPPTRGEVHVFGRVGSLLEVGTGFHPELTGRENVYLNGSILGMRRKEIDRRFDEIVDFAGVEQFLDTPVKRYSSGMYVRLAFAVAANLRADILLVDEVLAVGDADFQRRSISKMKDSASAGRTVVVVTHNLDLLTALCSSAALIEGGRVSEHDMPPAVVSKYRGVGLRGARYVRPVREPANGNGEYVVRSVKVAPESSSSGDILTIEVVVQRKAAMHGGLFVVAWIRNEEGLAIAALDSRSSFGVVTRPTEDLCFTFQMATPWLRPGSYSCDVGVGHHGLAWCDRIEGAVSYDVRDGGGLAMPISSTNVHEGIVVPDSTCDVSPHCSDQCDDDDED